MIDLVNILFLFAIGASIGSFLNVVVYRLPLGISLVTPPSHCPKCHRPLRWYDNLPVIGWIHLGGKCRFCHQPISIRYPIVEAFCGGIFVFYYVMFFILNIGPCPHAGIINPDEPRHVLSIFTDWPIYVLYMYLLCGLLAASLIDAERFEIPIDLLWSWKGGIVWVALAAHALMDRPSLPGNLLADPIRGALAAGGVVGLLASVGLLYRGIIPRSFAEGLPLLEIEKERLAQAGNTDEQQEFTPGQIRIEMRKEILFLLPPLAAAFGWLVLTMRVPGLNRAWEQLLQYRWVSGLLGSAFGALIGGLVVWVTRIIATIVFGREAMGLGDAHLMAAVGAVLGAGATTVAFFLAPFFGIALAIYLLLVGKRRELPYGPYLSMASGLVMLFYCPIAAYLAPGLIGLGWMIGQWFGIRSQ